MAIHIEKLIDHPIEIFDTIASWYNDPEITPYSIPRFSEVEYIHFKGIYLQSAAIKNNNMYNFIVYDDEHPIGECSVVMGFEQLVHNEPNTAWISLVIGDKSYWGKGISKLMMIRVEDECRALGATAIELGVFDYNKKAHRLYTKLGYKEIAKIEHFVFNFGEWHSDIRMLKMLNPSY